MGNLNVLICGGGIAGNALAFWLTRIGHTVTVVEHFPSLRVTGLQVDLRGHGLEVFKKMGLLEKARSKMIQEEGLELVDDYGKRWAYFPVNRSGKGTQSFSSEFEIMRGDMCQLLWEAAQEKTRYLFGKTVQHYVEKEDSVDVTFSDGEMETFDLLVGADGIGSRTRKLMLGTESSVPVDYVGTYVAYYTLPRPIQPREDYRGTAYVTTGQRMILTRRHRDDQVQVYLICKPGNNRLQDARKRGVDEEKAVLTDLYRGAGWRTDEFLKGLKETNNFYCERIGVVRMDSWHSHRVALIGDAAHCPTLLTGMGTSSAIVGAYILAGEISQHCGGADGKSGLSQALASYDQKYRPFMEQVQKGISKDSISTYLPSSRLAVLAVKICFALVSFLRLNVFGQYLLGENARSWVLPDYKGMVDMVQ